MHICSGGGEMAEGPGEVRISFILPTEERQAFKEACVKLRLTMSDVLRGKVHETIAKAAAREQEEG